MASQTDVAEKWDQRYRDKSVEAFEPVEVLVENLHLLPPGGRALDLACGLGPNALLLAEHGLRVTALDISPVAIEKLQRVARARDLAIDARVVDVTQEPLKPSAYDVIVVSRFLDRNLVAALMRALGTGGLLFYQTFTQENEGKRPRTPAFLLAPNELLRLFGPLRVLVYREEGRIGDTTRGRRGEALLVGQRT